MNMIERIARALARRNYPGASDADIDEMWSAWVDDATAAIQAMREPTPGMVEAGQEVPLDVEITGGVIYSAATEAKAIWQAMIDAAAIDTGVGEG